MNIPVKTDCMYGCLAFTDISFCLPLRILFLFCVRWVLELNSFTFCNTLFEKAIIQIISECLILKIVE